MREAIWEYLTPSEDEKEALWRRCIFVFDTNVILNLYRFTSNTREALLSAIDDLKERVWLPHQVAYEYAKNRFEVIFETVDKYQTLERMKEDFVTRCAKELRSKPSDEAIKQLQDSINAWIIEQKKLNLLVTDASDDSILEKVLSIFDRKVGEAFSEEELIELQAEGKERFAKQIPPGFCDAKKEKDGLENNIYGDLIIWKQILKFASENRKDIIYVTHDQKLDWWFISKGRTVGPRVELRKEFSQETSQEFYMYSMEGFLEQYSKHSGHNTDQNVLDEVTNIVRDMRFRKGENRVSNFVEHAMVIERDIFYLKGKISRLERAIANVETKYYNKIMPQDVVTQMQNTRSKKVQLERQLLKKQEELCYYQSRIQ